LKDVYDLTIYHVLFANVAGPGCSSVGFGQAQELGPFRVKKDVPELEFNQYSWNQGKLKPTLTCHT
jgi:carboxypeptidase C (cathepsin A)